VIQHRPQPLLQVRREPVDHRPLRQVRQIALQLRQLPVEHQAHADQLPAPVEPAHRLRAPLRLHVAPRRHLHVARRGQRAEVRQMLLAADGPQGQAHTGAPPASLPTSLPTSVAGSCRSLAALGRPRGADPLTR
jgi:hypothetical protein